MVFLQGFHWVLSGFPRLSAVLLGFLFPRFSCFSCWGFSRRSWLFAGFSSRFLVQFFLAGFVDFWLSWMFLV